MAVGNGMLMRGCASLRTMHAIVRVYNHNVMVFLPAKSPLVEPLAMASVQVGVNEGPRCEMYALPHCGEGFNTTLHNKGTSCDGVRRLYKSACRQT